MMLAGAALASPAVVAAGPAGAGPAAAATGDPVVVALMYPKIDVAIDLGLAEAVGEIPPVWEAFVDAANEAGGLAGRPIQLEPVEFDFLVDGDSVSACLTATEDRGAFLVIGTGGVFGDPVVCVAEQHETLMIGADGFPREFYERAEGRLFSLLPSKETTQLAIVSAFADELAGAPFAVLSGLDTGGDNDSVQDTLLPALAAADLEPATTIVLDSDGEVAASQIPLEVAELQDLGVETVISTTNFVATAPMSQALAAAGIDVRWIGSDAAGFAGNLFARQMVPEQLDGAEAVSFTRIGDPEDGSAEPEFDSECRSRAAELLGVDMPIGGLDTGTALMACSVIDLLVAAGAAVDGDLTTESFSAAMQTIDDFPLAGFGSAGFGEGRFEAAREARRIEWSADCECWSAVGEFEPVAADVAPADDTE